jgi:two-component system nitrogen regulation sensor histidine kinase NtrY
MAATRTPESARLRGRPAAPSSSTPPAPPRRPLRDNPLLILLWIGLLLVALAAMVYFADSSALQLYPVFLSEVVFSAVVVVDLTLMVALVFVLARNILKLIVERRRALPFARFRAKLVAVLLGMTLIPALLVLIVGSELIRNSASRWFSAPVDDVLSSARQIASDYYQERQQAVNVHAAGVARALAGIDLAPDNVSAIRAIIAPEVTQRQLGLIEVYRIVDRGSPPTVVPVVDVAAPALPSGFSRASADLLAMQTAGGLENTLLEPLHSGGELMRAASLVRGAPNAPPVGVVVVSDYLTGELARHSRRIVDAYEGYRQLRVLKGPLEGVYLSFFLGLTLMILVSATWMGLYLAKRITRPIQMLAEGAREIGAGHLDHRIEPETVDEFGSLVDAFNAMTGELAVSRRRLERSRLELERKSLEAEERRRYLETILERIATGVICLDADERISIVNTAARRLLGFDDSVIGEEAATVFAREDLSALAITIRGAKRVGTLSGEEVALVRDGREMHLAVASTTLQGEDGIVGMVLVLDDVTPLMRAQKVAAWRDVARRLAHEIKNPLTPIQLSAERLRRHFAKSPEPQRTLVEECSTAIVTEVESLKSLVDEFSQFARMPAPRTVPADLHPLLTDTLSLYNGLLDHITIEPRFAEAVPRVRVDPEQFRRVIINLVDNAIEALNGAREAGLDGGHAGHIGLANGYGYGHGDHESRAAGDFVNGGELNGRPAVHGMAHLHGVANGHADGLITIETSHDPANAVVRVAIADNGPGLPAGDRTKLFMPYYSTKGRGSGLGLAIVRRIIAEHGGNIEAGDNQPHGTRFTIELPC